MQGQIARICSKFNGNIENTFISHSLRAQERVSLGRFAPCPEETSAGGCQQAPPPVSDCKPVRTSSTTGALAQACPRVKVTGGGRDSRAKAPARHLTFVAGKYWLCRELSQLSPRERAPPSLPPSLAGGPRPCRQRAFSSHERAARGCRHEDLSAPCAPNSGCSVSASCPRRRLP